MTDGQWQPIETAPKDGTEIDLWTACGERVVSARWKTDGYLAGNWVFWCMDGSGPTELERVHCTATHWMPLPKPPAAGGADA